MNYRHRMLLPLMILIAGLAFPTDAQEMNGQTKLMKDFDSQLNPSNCKEWMKLLSSHPHHVGSPWDKKNAEFISSQFASWGFNSRIEEFFVLFPTPKTRLLEMTAPQKFTAKLKEPALAEDGTSDQKDEQLPTYNIYSADGDVTAELVYVNYGVPKDYETLAENGINVKGKIVIARYGGSWRGIKPKVAFEHGAVGCIIYSDPKDDGYYRGDTYPAGALRSEDGAQRGSVADMPTFAGDPLTPFVAATKDAQRLAVKDAPTIMKIPVLPISYADALPLLKNLGGPVAPDAWRGALPMTYHLGPGKSVVHLKLEFNWDIKPIYNVISELKGSEFPDEWIIRGNHHDAWVNGASDPVSGQVAMMEEARSIGELVKKGWKPKRTLLYCAWDGEEPGLLGSTEWVEAHAQELTAKAAVYINSDGNGRGFLDAEGSQALRHFVNDIAKGVTDPERNISVYERLRSRILLTGTAEQKAAALEKKDFQIGALGSGSDFTPFLQHLGIAALNVGFGGEDDGGSYHSIYDSYDQYLRFSDGEFTYAKALAEFAGHAVISMSEADYLPFRFTDFSDAVKQYMNEITKLTDEMREKSLTLNKMIDDKIYFNSSDPHKYVYTPGKEDAVPFLNFAALQNAVTKLQSSASEYSTAANAFTGSGKTLSKEKKTALNHLLFRSERALTFKAGLPRRPWYTHAIYAPGFYTGYGVKTLPGIREAVEQRNWKEAEQQIVVVASLLDEFAGEVLHAMTVFTGE
jgi:N-acetylated-alpha-linked acidic dipeptidase